MHFASEDRTEQGRGGESVSDSHVSGHGAQCASMSNHYHRPNGATWSPESSRPEHILMAIVCNSRPAVGTTLVIWVGLTRHGH